MHNESILAKVVITQRERVFTRRSKTGAEGVGRNCKEEVGEIILSLTTDENKLQISTQDSKSELTLAGQAAFPLFLATEKLFQTILKKTISNPGTERLLSEEGIYPEKSEEALFQEQLETVSSSSRESEARWWLAFISENNHRLRLVTQLIFELKSRGASVGEFFDAYIYSETDNIQANLHFMDYLQSFREPPLPTDSEHVLAALEFVKKELRSKFDIETKDEAAKALWKKMDSSVKDWGEDDCHALINLSHQLATYEELINLASLAQTFRPISLFHFHEYLRLADNKCWYSMVHTNPEYISEKYSAHLKLLKVLKAVFFDSLDINSESPPSIFTADEIEQCCKSLPLNPENRAQVGKVMQGMELSQFSLEDVPRLEKAFKYLLSEGELKSLLMEKQPTEH